METTIGEINGSEIEFNIEDSNCKAYICVEINRRESLRFIYFI